jgi:hypothetical protein
MKADTVNSGKVKIYVLTISHGEIKINDRLTPYKISESNIPLNGKEKLLLKDRFLSGKQKKY